MHSYNRAIISFRIGPQRWMDDDRFAELLDLFERHPGVTDEIAFFTHDTHSPLPVDVLAERALILAKRINAARQKGYRAGINHLATLGHLNENLPNSLSGPEYGHIVGIDGNVAEGSLCPNDEKVRAYIDSAYRVLAMANPDFIWTDDDMRLSNHYPVMVGCFCENCLSIFSKETGHEYTRECLQEAFSKGILEQKIRVRKAWVEHHKSTMERTFALVERSVHEVNPDVAIGSMPTELLFDGYNYVRTSEILSGPDHKDVMWRPGEGFYFDTAPSGILIKAHSLGRQASMIPDNITSIQAEIENFPYQPLKKSRKINALEGAAYIAAGCTGAAFNVLPMLDETLSEYESIVQKIADTRPFYDLLMQNIRRSKPSGLHTGWCKDSIVAMNMEADAWFGGVIWGNIFSHADEILDLGLPVAYSPEAAPVTLLEGDSVAAMSESDILRVLSAGVYMDGKALSRLNSLGYGEFTGFTPGKIIEHDSLERLTDHAINAQFGSTRRDARQSFVWWGVPVYDLNPVETGCETLAEAVDYSGSIVSRCCMGIYENSLGGRICVAGYYPWTFLQSYAKAMQMKSLMRWLSRENIPAYIESFDKAALWCRHSEAGGLVVCIINTSLDTADSLELMLKTDSNRIYIYDMNCRETEIDSVTSAGTYRKFILPAVGSWEMRLITTV